MLAFLVMRFHTPKIYTLSLIHVSLLYKALEEQLRFFKEMLITIMLQAAGTVQLVRKLNVGFFIPDRDIPMS